MTNVVPISDHSTCQVSLSRPSCASSHRVDASHPDHANRHSAIVIVSLGTTYDASFATPDKGRYAADRTEYLYSAPDDSLPREKFKKQGGGDDRTILGHTIMGLAGLSRALVAR